MRAACKALTPSFQVIHCLTSNALSCKQLWVTQPQVYHLCSKFKLIFQS